jgi:hypothetical protein
MMINFLIELVKCNFVYGYDKDDDENDDDTPRLFSVSVVYT